MTVLSLAFGLIYGIGLTYNFPHFFRGRIALFRSHRRNPWQPWVGGLRDAEQVMIQRGGGSDVVGILAEYSRAEKERQILLVSPRFLDFEDEPNRERVLIPENEIMMVHILSTKKRKGAGSQIGETIKRIWGVLPGSETDTPVEENAGE